MSEKPSEKPPRPYAVVGPGEQKPPDYVRVVRRLSVEELEAEIREGRGTAAYRRECEFELERRAREDEG